MGLCLGMEAHGQAGPDTCSRLGFLKDMRPEEPRVTPKHVNDALGGETLRGLSAAEGGGGEFVANHHLGNTDSSTGPMRYKGPCAG